MIDINEIEKQFQTAISQKIQQELDAHNFTDLLAQQIDSVVQEKINVTVTQLLNQLITSETVSEYVHAVAGETVQKKLDSEVKARVAQTVTQVDLGTQISNCIVQFVDQRMQQGALPENFIPANSILWQGHRLSADCIGTGTIHDFTSDGIQDQATEINLTVLDGQVVVENETVTKQLTVVDRATVNALTVGSLTVNNGITINDSGFVDQIRGLIDNRISQHASDSDWDTNGKPLKCNDVTLINDKSLGNTVVESNLRKLGRLSDLNVIGETSLAETVYVNNGRLGINTDEPAGVFSAWDEESEITIRKYKQRTMYIGSSRDSELVLGVGGDAALNVRRNGVEVNNLKIGNTTFSSANSAPSHRGSPGDLVINSQGGATQPWAWRCTGGESWIPLT